jgi:hypothetical protein
MMTEFYVKVVLASIQRAYGPEAAGGFFTLLQCYVLEVFSVLEGQERTLEGVIPGTKKESDDVEAELLRCRREIYACFKLLGDMASSGYTEAGLVEAMLEA